MTYLFDGNTLDKVAEGSSVSPEIETLKQILHHRSHFAELAAQAFLQCIGS